MGLLERIKNVVQANINDLIDASRDPEDMLERFIGQSEEDLEKAKSEMASAVREERRLKQRIAEEQRRVTHWEEKALQAVQKSDDEQARDIIRRKRRAARSLQLVEQQWAEQENLVELLRRHIEELQEKLQEMKLRRSQLAARHRVLEMRRRYRERLQEYAEEFGLEAPEPEPLPRRKRPVREDWAVVEAEPPRPRRPEPDPNVEIEHQYRLQEIEREKVPSLEEEIEEELRLLKARPPEEEEGDEKTSSEAASGEDLARPQDAEEAGGEAAKEG